MISLLANKFLHTVGSLHLCIQQYQGDELNSPIIYIVFNTSHRPMSVQSLSAISTSQIHCITWKPISNNISCIIHIQASNDPCTITYYLKIKEFNTYCSHCILMLCPSVWYTLQSGRVYHIHHITKQSKNRESSVLSIIIRHPQVRKHSLHTRQILLSAVNS